MRSTTLRFLCAAWLIAALAGCQSSGFGRFKKSCDDCASGTCDRHKPKVEPDSVPGQSPFTPFPTGK
jgi:hypothetical protein